MNTCLWYVYKQWLIDNKDCSFRLLHYYLIIFSHLLHLHPSVPNHQTQHSFIWFPDILWSFPGPARSPVCSMFGYYNWNYTYHQVRFSCITNHNYIIVFYNHVYVRKKYMWFFLLKIWIRRSKTKRRYVLQFELNCQSRIEKSI